SSAARPRLVSSVHAHCPVDTPTAVRTPLRRPPASVFRIVNAVSCPGVTITTIATPRNAARCAIAASSHQTGAWPRMGPGPGCGYVTTRAGLANGTSGDVTRTLVPAGTFTVMRNVPEAPVRFVPPIDTQRPPLRRWITYDRAPEPGRTCPQSSVL